MSKFHPLCYNGTVSTLCCPYWECRTELRLNTKITKEDNLFPFFVSFECFVVERGFFGQKGLEKHLRLLEKFRPFFEKYLNFNVKFRKFFGFIFFGRRCVRSSAVQPSPTCFKSSLIGQPPDGQAGQRRLGIVLAEIMSGSVRLGKTSLALLDASELRPSDPSIASVPSPEQASEGGGLKRGMDLEDQFS
jgi:hypothetical protein